MTRVGVLAERVARSIAVFVAASAALLVITAQFAPGWRAADEVEGMTIDRCETD